MIPTLPPFHADTEVCLENFSLHQELGQDTRLKTHNISNIEASSKGTLIPSGLIIADNVFDCLPLGSTLSNAINLGLKHLVFEGSEASSSSYKDYIEYLNQKKTTTCMTYAVPVLGNLCKLGILATKAFTALCQAPRKTIIEPPLLKDLPHSLPSQPQKEESSELLNLVI